MAVLNIPDPSKPPFPYTPTTSDDDTIRMLILTVESLRKDMKWLEKRIYQLERKQR